MPIHKFTSPQGEEYEVPGPEGSTREQAFGILQEGLKNGHYKPIVTKPEEPSRETTAGSFMNKAALEQTGAEIKSWLTPKEQTKKDVAAQIELFKIDPVAAIKKATNEFSTASKGFGDAALNIGTSLYGSIMSPISGLVNQAIGDGEDWRSYGGRLAEEKTYTNRDERGEEYSRIAGKFITDALMPMGLGNLSGMAGPAARLRAGKTGRPNAAPEIVKPDMEATLDAHQASNIPTQSGIPTEATYKYQQQTQPIDPGVGAFDNIRKQQGAPTPEPILAPMERMAQQLGEKNTVVNDTKAIEAQRILQERQTAMEQTVARQTSLDQNAANRARQEAAPTGAEEHFTNQDINEAAQSAEQLRQLNERGQQMHITEDFGNNDPMSRMPNMRVDENGIPIRADLSVEAQNLQNPLQRNLWGDELPVKTGDGGVPLTQALDQMPPGTAREAAVSQLSGINRFGQGGSAPMLNDLANGIIKVGAGLKAKFTGASLPVESSLLRPTSPQDIAAKNVLASKATAVGLDNSVYHAVKTIEEVRANPGKDITTTAQDLTPGTQAVLRKNKTNRLLSYTNNNFTEARLGKMKDSVRLITNDADGYLAVMRKVPEKEIQTVHELSLMLDRKGMEWSRELGDKLGLSKEAQDFMDKRMFVNDEVANKADAVLQKNGMKLLDRRVSYASATFDTKYQQLVYKVGTDAKGKPTYSIVAPLNAKSAWELSRAKNWATEKYAEQLKSGEYTIGDVKRQGLSSDTSRYRPMSDSAQLMKVLTDNVPEVKQLKAELDAYIESKTKELYQHNVHELHKKGVVGSIGDRPWLDAKTNASDFFKAEVAHVEQALDYWHYQDAIGETRKAIIDPSIVGMEKTKKYLSRFLDSNYGGALNPLGALSNSLVDIAYQGMQNVAVWANKDLKAKKGWSPEDNPTAHLGNVRDVMFSQMMGWVNPMFTGVQITQLATGVGPELARIRSEFGLNPTTVGIAIGNGLVNTTIMSIASKAGKLNNLKALLPDHIIEAYKWAKEHGITQYNEIEQEHHAEYSKGKALVKEWATKPAAMGEILSTPPAYVAIVDMLHQAGMRGENLHVAAYESLKYAMTEYHPDAAPMIYTRSGIAGTTMGGLKKYVHNAVDQQVSRTLEAGKHPAAFATMAGTFVFFAGATGILGYNQANKLSLVLTDKDLNGHWDDAFGTGKHSHGIRNGYASALTNWDLQTRYSMSDSVPGSFAEGVQGPVLTKSLAMVAAAYNYAKNQDTMSGLELAKAVTPAGTATGMLDQATNVDSNGFVLDKQGQTKYSEPRTPREQAARQYLGVRPIRERLVDEHVYNQTLVDQKKNKAKGDAMVRLDAALYRKDDKGFNTALQDFQNNEGNLEQLGPHIQKYMEEKQLSKLQRKGGLDPSKNLERWKRYNP